MTILESIAAIKAAAPEVAYICASAEVNTHKCSGWELTGKISIYDGATFHEGPTIEEATRTAIRFHTSKINPPSLAEAQKIAEEAEALPHPDPTPTPRDLNDIPF